MSSSVFRSSGPERAQGRGSLRSVFRHVLYAALLLFLYLVQTCGPARFTARGAEFALPFVLAAAWSCGPWAGTAYGLAAGILYDAQSGLMPSGALALAVFLLCVSAGAAARRRPGFWPYMCAAAAALALVCALCLGLTALALPVNLPAFLVAAALKLATGLLFAPLCWLIVSRTAERGR